MSDPKLNRCGRHGDTLLMNTSGKGHCRCRWAGNGVIRGTKAEATRFATRADAKKIREVSMPRVPAWKPAHDFKVVKVRI
jgi:hypothetical protein